MKTEFDFRNQKRNSRSVKRMLAGFLAVVLVMSLFSITAFAKEKEASVELFASGGSATGNADVEIRELTLGNTIDVSSDGASLWYSFTPAESGIYFIKSLNLEEGDPYVALYDQDWQYIQDNDDGREGWNFYLRADLTAGETYYYRVSDLDVDGEAFTFSILFNRLEDLTIQSIQVDPLTVYEGLDSWEASDWIGEDDTEVFYTGYDVEPKNMTIQANGQTYTGSYSDVFDQLEETYADPDGLLFARWYQSTQSYQNPWQVGKTYQATLIVGSFSVSYDVAVKANPITAVNAMDVVISSDDYEEDFDEYGILYTYYPVPTPPYIEVTAEGVTYDGSPYAVAAQLQAIYGSSVRFYLRDNQSSRNEWSAGKTYPVDFYFGGVKSTYNATIVTAYVPLEYIVLTKTDITLQVGDTEQLKAALRPKDASYQQLIWKSEDSNIVSVDKNGLLTAVGEGTAGVYVCSTDPYRDISEHATVTVTKADLSKASISIPDQTYSGSALTPKPTVKIGAVTLKEGTDYTIASYSDNTNAGTAAIKLTAKGNRVTGTASKTFTIKAKSAKPTVTLSKQSAAYTGKAQTPTVTVKVNGKKLASSAYTVSWSGARKTAGSYTAAVTLKGNYTGSAKAAFKITKAKQKATVKAGKTKSVSKAKTKKKAQTVKKAITVKKATGKVTYTKVKKGSSKYLSINKKTGAVTVKKGTPKGLYKIKVKVKAAGNKNYKAFSKTVTVKVRVK